ncbi:MAG TPA: PBSX family phage terminase large subunit [Phytomonospora sp.]
MRFDALTGKQVQSVQLATTRTNVWEGAVRSSKTISSIMKWLRYTRTGPQGALLMVGKTERTLKRNIVDPIQEMVGTKRCKFKSGTGEVELLGRTIYVAGAHDEGSADRIKGLTLAGAYGDELTTWPESFYSMLGTRLSIPGAQMFGTTNPGAPTHWLMRDHLKRARVHLDRHGNILTSHDPEALNLSRFSFQLADNPSLTAEYVEEISKEFTGLFYRRYVLGEWVLAEGAIFDKWDENLHVVDELPSIQEWIAVGIDYGTVNPFHAVMLGLGADGILYATSEYRHDSRAARKQKTDTEYADDILAWLASKPTPAHLIVDPSAASFRQEMRSRGYHTGAGDNSVLDGIRTLAGLLGRGVLKIHRSCTGLIDEMPGYSWDDKAAEKGLDEPLKLDDHGVDALRYAVHTTRKLWRWRIKHQLTEDLGGD